MKGNHNSTVKVMKSSQHILFLFIFFLAVEIARAYSTLLGSKSMINNSGISFKYQPLTGERAVSHFPSMTTILKRKIKSASIQSIKLLVYILWGENGV